MRIYCNVICDDMSHEFNVSYHNSYGCGECTVFPVKPKRKSSECPSPTSTVLAKIIDSFVVASHDRKDWLCD